MATDYLPFKGFIDERPYPVSGLTSKLWLAIPIQKVVLKDLVLTQRGVFIDPLFSNALSYSKDAFPHVIIWNNDFYLEDGHHRVVLAALKEQKTVLARVFKSLEN